MTQNQRFFLDQFDQSFRQNIISCCENISQQHYDVIILMARKASCFLSVLEDFGLVSLNGRVVSDRVLMFKTEWLIGKRVAIIDDTIISGTTIGKMIRQLRDIGVSDISVHAFCIDNSWFVDELLEDGGVSYLHQSYMRVSHSVSIRFCRQIVDALLVIPRPYNIDFPIYETSSLTSEDFSTITECDGWVPVDTVTKTQHDNCVESLSLNFRNSFMSEFYSTIGGDYSKVLFAKIRIFAKRLHSGEMESKVVPYVMFNPVKSQFADNIICAIAKSEGVDGTDLSDLLETGSSKMLFIQHYFAERLFLFWKSYSKVMLSKELVFSEDERDKLLLFPQQVIDILQSFHYNSRICMCPDDNNEQFLYDNTVRGKDGVHINPSEISDELTKKFLYLYYNRELNSRRIVKRLSKDIYTDAEYTSVEKRLEEGPSFLELIRTIAPLMNDSFDIRLMLSTFLDNAIDKGIVVPITVDDGAYLYRGFRHGEEVIWGDMTDKLIALFFEGIFDKNGQVSRLRFEKLLVLFLKIGVRRNMLEQFIAINPPLEKTRLICVRSYLFGEVAVEHEYDPAIRSCQRSLEQEFDPILTNECSTSWTSTRYKAQKILLKASDDRNKHYVLNFDNLYHKKYEGEVVDGEPSDFDEKTVDMVSELSEVFKICFDNKLLNDDNLVVLTSCIHLNDNEASIGAELHIFKSEIDNLVNMVESRLKMQDIDVPFLQSLRSYETNKIWTAINSGAFKFFSFKNHVAKDIINSVSEKLKKIDPRTARDWRGIWREELELTNDVNKELNALNDRMGLLIYDILLTLQYLHSLIYEMLERNGANQRHVTEYRKNKKAISVMIDNKRYKDDAEKELLVKRRNQFSHEYTNWEKYVEKNAEKAKTWVEELHIMTQSDNDYPMAAEVINKRVHQYSDEAICLKIRLVIEKLKDYKTLATQCIEDHRILMPRYGVVRPSVRYFSLLHLNVLTTDKTERKEISMMIMRELNNTDLSGIKDSGENTMVLLRSDKMKDGGRGYVICSRGRSYSERLLQLGCQILRVCCNNKKNIIISFVPDIPQGGIKVFYNDENEQYDILYGDIDYLLPDNKEESVLCIYSQGVPVNIGDFRNHIRNCFLGEFLLEEQKPDDKKVAGRVHYCPKGMDSLC